MSVSSMKQCKCGNQTITYMYSQILASNGIIDELPMLSAGVIIN